MEQLKEENPHITDEDLEIKLSEAVKNKKAANPGPRVRGDPAMLGFLPQRLNPPAIPPIQHLIPPVQPVPPPAQPDVRAAREVQLQALREAREGLRRNALHMNALRDALQANIAQPGQHGRARQQAVVAARQQAVAARQQAVAARQQAVTARQQAAVVAQQQQAAVQQELAAAQQELAAAHQELAAHIPLYPARRHTLPVNVVQGVARQQTAGLPIGPNQAMELARQQRAAFQANTFQASAQQQAAENAENAVQPPAAQLAQAASFHNRLRRNTMAPAAAAPLPANPIAPWQAANPPIPGSLPALRNSNARLQELHQGWRGAWGGGDYPYIMYPGQAAAAAAAAGGDGQAAAIPGGIPAAGANTASNPPAAGGVPPMGFLRRRRG